MSEIIIKNLNKSYGNNKVINDFNIKITDGEFIVLGGTIWLWKVDFIKNDFRS